MIPLCSRFDSLAFTVLPVSISSEIDFSRSPLADFCDFGSATDPLAAAGGGERSGVA
jgi:hypothetical protein